MFGGTDIFGDAPRRFEFDAVALVIVDRQRDDARAGLAREARTDNPVETSTQEYEHAFSRKFLTRLQIDPRRRGGSAEHTATLQTLKRNSDAHFILTKKMTI